MAVYKIYKTHGVYTRFLKFLPLINVRLDSRKLYAETEYVWMSAIGKDGKIALTFSVRDMWNNNGTIHGVRVEGNIAVDSANSVGGIAAYNNGIISVVKHFPGHGVTKIDSHFITPYVYDYKKVLNCHIKPFDKVFFLFKNILNLLLYLFNYYIIYIRIIYRKCI